MNKQDEQLTAKLADSMENYLHNQTVNDYQAINKIKLDENKLNDLTPYSNIIINLSNIHYTALCMYIISSITLTFLIYQIILISRLVDTLYLLSVLEFSSLVALSFLGGALGISVNSYYLSSNLTSQKTKVQVCSAVTIGILLFSIISFSEYLLFLCYPLLSLFSVINYCAAKEYFEDYWANPCYESIKSSLITVLSISTLLVYFNYTQLLRNWNYYLIPFAFLHLAMIILSFWMYETPIYLFKRKEYDQLVPQLEIIKGKFLEEGERELIYEEMRQIYEIQKTIKVSTIFCENYKYFSIFYFLIIFCLGFSLVGILLLGSNYFYDAFYNRFRTFSQLFYFLILGIFGPLLGWSLTSFTKVKRKIYVASHFGLMILFSSLGVGFNANSHYFAGVYLFLSLSLLVTLVKMGWEVYSEPLHNKINTLFMFSMFFTGFITVLVVNPLYFYRLNAAWISLIFISTAGFVLSFFPDKDIN